MRRLAQFPWRGLPVQFFGLVILPLAGLLLATTFGGLWVHRQSMRTMVGERDARAVSAAASAIREQLYHRAAALQGLAIPVGTTSDAASLQAVLDEYSFLLTDFDAGLAIFTRTGDLLAQTGDATLWDPLTPETRAALQSVLARDVPPPFHSLPHPLTGEPLTLVTAPTHKGGPVVLGAFFPANLAYRTLTGVFSPHEGLSTDYGLAAMVDVDYRVLYQTGEFGPGETARTHPGVGEALAGNRGATYIQIEDSEHVIAFSPIAPTGWALVLEEPWEELASPLLRLTENAPLLLVLVSLFALAALWLGIRQVVAPLQALESKAADLAWGNFEAIEEPVGGIAEIRRLQNELIHLAKKVKAAQQSLRGYIGAMTTGQEEERRRLGRELHDDTLQALIALNQRVQLAQLAIHDEAARAQLEEIRLLSQQTITNLRRTTRALRPIYLEELGLVAALEMLGRETKQTSGLEVRFTQNGPQRRLPAPTELALYRITQEALTNVGRHASASHAQVALTFTPTTAVLQIQDDGRGFEPPESPAELAPQGHYGLLGMQERAELIGARLEIETAPGEGTAIRVVVEEGSLTWTPPPPPS